MPALYSHTTRANGTVLTATIYNGDHQNHIDNGVPAQLDDYSVDVGQMQSQVSPGTVGAESLPTSLAGELERLRHVIAAMKGKSFWYDPSGAAGGLLNVQVFTASGTYTATTGTNKIIVEALGGGGGGGGCAAQGSGSACTSPGGSAGAWGKALITSSFSGTTVTIGAGGAGGSAGANAGAAGGQTSFGTKVVCPGGLGGSGNTGSSGNAFIGSADASSAPTISGTGVTALASAPGSAGVSGIQLAGGSNAQGGAGGSSHYGGASRVAIANGTNLSVNGLAAVGFGSGGGGGTNTSTGAAAGGGGGGGGLVIVYEFT